MLLGVLVMQTSDWCANLSLLSGQLQTRPPVELCVISFAGKAVCVLPNASAEMLKCVTCLSIAALMYSS